MARIDMKRILLISAMLLSACASIPDLSAVSVVTQVDVNVETDPVRVIARPPSKDMTPSEIVEGYVAATASMTNDYFVARQYLTAAAAKEWKSDGLLVIDPKQTTVVSRSASEVVLQLVALGQLNSMQRMQWFDAPQTKSFSIVIEKADAGYRIGSSILPIALSTKDFLRNYSQFNVYFLNQDFTQLIPDQVWLSSTQSTSPTQVVTSLLAGTPDDFQAALRTAVPAGTKLEIAAVTTTEAVSSVTLGNTYWTLSKAERNAFIAQFVWTLTDLPGVSAVSITSGGQPIVIDGKRELTRKQFASFDPDVVTGSLYVSDSRGLLSYADSQFTRVSKFSGIQHLAMSGDSKRIAFIKSGSAYLARVSALNSATFLAENIASVAIDADDRVWLVGQDGSLSVSIAGAVPVAVSGAPAHVSALATAPDGVRIATVEPRSSGNIVEIHAVVTTPGGVSLTTGRRVPFAADAVDVDWLYTEELVAIGKTAESGTQIYRITFDGLPARVIGAVTNASHVIAAPNQPIAVLSSQGLLTVLVDGSWQTLRTVAAASYSG